MRLCDVNMQTSSEVYLTALVKCIQFTMVKFPKLLHWSLYNLLW